MLWMGRGHGDVPAEGLVCFWWRTSSLVATCKMALEGAAVVVSVTTSACWLTLMLAIV
jgi:hypothetical protein